MSLTEMLTKISELTTQERFLGLEALSRALRAELEPHTPAVAAGRLLGIIATDADLTDEDLDQIRFEQLMGHHS